MLPLVREDALEVVPADDGCEVAPRCLDCPLPQCRFDTGFRLALYVSDRRQEEAVRLRDDAGLGACEIAERLGVTLRTVYRYWRQAARV